MPLFDRPTDVDQPSDFFLKHTNDLLNGQWGNLIVFSVFIVTFLALIRFGSEEAFIPAAFAAFITSVLLVPFGITSDNTFLFTAIILAASVFLKVIRSR